MCSGPEPISTSAVYPPSRRHVDTAAATRSASVAPGRASALIASHIRSPIPAA
ncbi:Uncharacterised protein [Mycobacteroides abscessus subsp. abscessus]|nr:Uncharacterised protein [Mycobacteroides abscessus subsp. abscessus]